MAINWKYLLAIPIGILLVTMFTVFDYEPRKGTSENKLPTSSTSVPQYDRDCYPAMTPDNKYYVQCPPFSWEVDKDE